MNNDAPQGNNDTPLGQPGIRERRARRLPGLLMFVVTVLVIIGAGAVLVSAVGQRNSALDLPAAIILMLGVLATRGNVVVAPGEARVLQVFGRYTGTVRTPGWHWVNPLSTKKRISTRIRNHETPALKVNDAHGNPIQIAAVVVWQVADTAQATFEVDDFIAFVRIQTETAVRHIATSYPYDNHSESGLSLRDNADEITEKLSREITTRVQAAGVRILESRLTHLAYASEIAQAMLQRQQADALVAARQRIVEGAVGIVNMALHRLADQEVVELDEERKAAMISNLLVVLCGDRATQPVVNAGSLYQ